MDCMDLSYHHHMKHLVEAYTAAQQVVASTSEQHLLSLHSACSNLNARSDKQQFLQTQPAFAVEPELFKADINRQFQSLPEVQYILLWFYLYSYNNIWYFRIWQLWNKKLVKKLSI